MKKKFFSFCFQVGVMFQKSSFPTILNFARVMVAHQLHVRNHHIAFKSCATRRHLFDYMDSKESQIEAANIQNRIKTKQIMMVP